MLSYLWGGKTEKPENTDPELALREACDAHGEFTTKIDGTLEWDHFLIFRAIIMRQSARMFEKKRAELNERKLEAFTNKDQPAYVKIFREGQVAFNQSIQHITKKACEWIELDLQNYSLTVKAFFEDKDKRQVIQQKDAEVRMALEDRPIEETEAEIIKASKFKFKRDMEMYRKLQSLKFTTSPEAQNEIMNIEMSKTSDALLLEYGFDLSHLVKCSKHFKLHENEEIKSFQRLVVAQKESEEKAEFERASPPKEVLEELLKDGKKLGEPQYKSDGTMTFDFFLDTSKIVVMYTHKQTKDGLAEHAVKRREAIKNNDEEAFQKLILQTANWEQLTNTLIQANLYQHLKVPKPVFEKSMQTYLMDPEKRAVYEQELTNLRNCLRDRAPRELTREECINSVRHLEQAKFDAQKKMYEFVRSQRVAPQMINAVIKVEKLKADDKFFNETGIEEEDVEPSLKRLDLEEDEEYKKIVEEFKVQSEEFLNSKKDETAAMMQKAAEVRKAMAEQRAAALAEAEKKDGVAVEAEKKDEVAVEAKVEAEAVEEPKK